MDQMHWAKLLLDVNLATLLCRILKVDLSVFLPPYELKIFLTGLIQP